MSQECLINAKLVFWDPWYNEAGQPTGLDLRIAQNMLDTYSQPGTVLLVFLKPTNITLWKDLIDRCKTKWWVDKNLFTVIRHPARSRGFTNAISMRCVTEYVLLAVRRCDDGKVPLDYRGFSEVTRMWPLHSGLPAAEFLHRSNCWAGYRPPTKSQRLKNDHGECVRPDAEKSMELLEWLVLVYTKPGDSVLDVQAGTASLGLACLKHGRKGSHARSTNLRIRSSKTTYKNINLGATTCAIKAGALREIAGDGAHLCRTPGLRAHHH